MIIKLKRLLIPAIVASSVIGFGVTTVVQAALTADSKLTQAINAGVISTDVRNSGGGVVGTPSFAMNAVSASTSAQTSTGTFGDNNQRITVDNPGGANAGWTLTLNAKVPGTSKWVSGGNNYSYNGNSTTGQLTINPAAGTLTAPIGGTANVTLGSQASFTGTTPITLVNAAAASADIWNGYVTGIGLSQAIPAAQPLGSYTIDMTQTVAAI